MEDIGKKLKEARESHGLDIPEVAEDLNMKESHIENIEKGNIKAFDDVFNLKIFIREYSKYLGLDSEKILDEFNEFLFDYTSKIPVEKIEKAAKEVEKKKETKEIVSPYTMVAKKKVKIPPKYIYISIGVLIVIVVGIYLFFSLNKDECYEGETCINNIIRSMV